MAEKSNSFRHEGNQVIHTRWLNAPRDLVWEVWTKPEHIKEWWGPNGFTLTHKSMDVKKGSAWRFTMHGMGMDFENKIEYLEVIKPSLLSYRHGDESDKISFTVHISFEEADGKTLLTMRSVFQSEEILVELNRQVNAIEGGKQTLDKLEAYLKTQLKLLTKNMERSSTAHRELIVTRLLNAPVNLVWEVWTRPEHIKNWWGPNGFTTTIHLMDVKPGGEWNFTMHGPDGTDFKNKSVFKEIIKHKKIVYQHVSPKFLATVEFESQGKKTFIKWHMLFESTEQFIQVVKTFKADEGLKQNVDKLDQYLISQLTTI